MNLTRFTAEAFYSPLTFFRYREGHPQALIFTQFFSAGAYVLLISHLLSFFGLKPSFLLIFFLTLTAFAGGFLKAGVFCALLNIDAPRVSLKKVWMIQALGLFPLYLTLPLLPLFEFSQGLSLVWIALSLSLAAGFRISFYRKIMGVKGHFVWVASVIQGFLMGALLIFSAGMGAAFLSRFLGEILRGIFS